MDVASIRRLFTYTEWANARMVECVRGLDQEHFTQPITSSFPTIRDTLAHIALAEWAWLRRWTGESPTAPPAWSREPSLETILEQWRAVETERRAFLDSLTDVDLDRGLAYRTISGETHNDRLGDLLAHVVNHSTYHRGQLTTMLRQVGAAPPTTDYIAFLR